MQIGTDLVNGQRRCAASGQRRGGIVSPRACQLTAGRHVSPYSCCSRRPPTASHAATYCW
jgi:hypothetical protein